MKRNRTGRFVLMCAAFFAHFSSFGQCGVDFTTQAYGTGPAVQINLTGMSQEMTYSVNVDWGDSQIDLGFTNEYIHTYASAGSYTICVQYISVAGQGCYQEVCKPYTIQILPNLCPLTVTPNLNNYTLTVNASGSGASDPVLSFVYDVWAYIADPFNFSLIESHSGNSKTFTHTYPSTDNKSYTYCVGYGDMNDPESCEATDYCATVSFGSSLVGVQDNNYSYLQVFPVPANDFITIVWEESISGNIEFELTDLTGKVLEKGILSQQTSVLLLPQTIGSGTYLLTVKEAGGKTNTVKFLKN